MYGRSNWWPVDQDVIAKFDDIQIYSQALSSIQINSLYQSSINQGMFLSLTFCKAAAK